MPRLPILLAYRPGRSNISRGAVVYLSKGTWKAVNEGHFDTEFAVVSDAIGMSPRGNEYIEGPCNVRVMIHRPGTEEHFSVYVEKIA